VTSARLRIAALGVGVAVALSGCVRVTSETTFNTDETFSQHAIVAFSPEAADTIGQQGGFDITTLATDLLESEELAELQDRFPGQVEASAYEDEDLRGFEFAATDLPLEEFTGAASQITSTVGTAATLELTDGSYIIEIEPAAVGDLGDLGVSSSALALLGDSVDVSLTYTFPGLVREATVGTVDGKTVTLGMEDLLSPTGIRIVADAQEAVYWTPILQWGGIALAVLAIAGGAFALARWDRNRSRNQPLPPPPGDRPGSTLGTLAPSDD
jgi:hypothetical protein